MTMRVVMRRVIEGALPIIPNGSIAVVSNTRVVLDVGVADPENVDNVIQVMRDVGAALWDDDEWRPTLRGEPDPEGLFAAVARSRDGGL